MNLIGKREIDSRRFGVAHERQANQKPGGARLEYLHLVLRALESHTMVNFQVLLFRLILFREECPKRLSFFLLHLTENT